MENNKLTLNEIIIKYRNKYNWLAIDKNREIYCYKHKPICKDNKLDYKAKWMPVTNDAKHAGKHKIKVIKNWEGWKKCIINLNVIGLLLRI